MKIILWTATNCPNCPTAKKIFNEVVQELNLKAGIDYEIKNVDEGENMIDALMHQVAATPSLTIDDDLIYNGEIPDKNELISIIKEKFRKF